MGTMLSLSQDRFGVIFEERSVGVNMLRIVRRCCAFARLLLIRGCLRDVPVAAVIQERERERGREREAAGKITLFDHEQSSYMYCVKFGFWLQGISCTLCTRIV